MSTEELVSLFGDAYEDYWRLSTSLTLKESKKSSGRKDLEQARRCDLIANELVSRPLSETLKLRRLLADERPGVRLMAAFTLEDFILNDAVETYLELAERKFGENGYADPYGAQSRLALGRLVRAGKIPVNVYPEGID